MDNHTAARFAQAFEQPIPEDHPRCEGCAEALSDDEQCHEGPDDLCNNCGTVCHSCHEQVWNDQTKQLGIKMPKGTSETTIFLTLNKEIFVCKPCHDVWIGD